MDVGPGPFGPTVPESQGGKDLWDSSLTPTLTQTQPEEWAPALAWIPPALVPTTFKVLHSILEHFPVVTKSAWCYNFL